MNDPDGTTLDRVAVLFAGDSGDGMQLVGNLFAGASALAGNEVRTLPDYPAEIRAPAGSLAGVSAFQLNLSDHPIHGPGDTVQALVAMNPAALKVYLERLDPGGVLIVNRDAFDATGLHRAGYAEDPLTPGGLDRRYRVFAVPVTTLTLEALKDSTLERRAKARCKNFLALGLASWLYGRPLEPTLAWIEEKFSRFPAVAEGNRAALLAGYHYGETTEGLASAFTIPAAPRVPGTYRMVNGNQALALGLATAARVARKPLVYSSYPITPASEVLHELARLKHLDVRTLQLEDEIAAMGSTIGAAFGGALAATGTSGPGICLKAEAINLAVMLELPMVIVNVQRGGPSTGLPTKTEQADLLQALFGRNGESPVPVVAPRSPADCFATALEAFRVAVRYMTPVFVLSEAYLAVSTEPWRIPRLEDLPDVPVAHPPAGAAIPPYRRVPETLARPWILPGTPGLEHRLGGLEKEQGTGAVSYDPDNHEHMCRLRADKVAGIARDLAPVEVLGEPGGELLVVTWGGTFGAAREAVERLRSARRPVSHLHLRWLNPFPPGLEELLAGFRRVLVPEVNLGQLAWLLRARYLVDARSVARVRGLPLSVGEIHGACEAALA